MIVHFDENITPQCMDAFQDLALSLAKTSMHTAQQLSYGLVAAIEDYQPENADGVKNEQYNFQRYLRCAKLLKLIEQVVVFRKTSEYPIHVTSAITNTDSKLAQQENDEFRKSGFLLYKRVKRKDNFHTKPWKRRFFAITHRVLLCYR